MGSMEMTLKDLWYFIENEVLSVYLLTHLIEVPGQGDNPLFNSLGQKPYKRIVLSIKFYRAFSIVRSCFPMVALALPHF